MRAELKALLWDCDGVILESEGLHRRAYNAVFQHYKVTVNGEVVNWSEEYYDVLSNTVGGGKPKMRWHFGKTGWPSSSNVPGACLSDAVRFHCWTHVTRVTLTQERDLLIDTLQDWKTNHYEELIKSGQVAPRPGVLRLMDEARCVRSPCSTSLLFLTISILSTAGLKVAVCSAATKSAAVVTVSSLLGKTRWEALDGFLAGNDVAKLKPDPLIYITACERLGVQPSECIVIEDSTVGLKASTAAGMRCVITYTSSGKEEPFGEAALVVSDLDAGRVDVARLRAAHAAGRYDDRHTAAH